MRRLIGTFALAASAIGAPAAAQVEVPGPEPTEYPGPVREETGPADERDVTDTGAVKKHWYVGGEFGGMIVEDTNVDIGPVDNALRLSHEYGYDGGLFVGYDLGAFRIEAEAAYKKADLEGFNTLIALPGENAVTFPPSRQFAGGSTSALSFMINGMLDFGDDENVGGISGFVGGGVGMARVKANNHRVFANSAPFLDDSDSKLAWQVFAGVRQRISDTIDVTVKYRFFNVDDVRMVAFNGNESEHRFRSHSLLGGITFNFGKPKPPPELYCKMGTLVGDQCIVTIPGPPFWRCPGDPTDYQSKPKCPGVVMGPYIVFFAWDKPRPETPEDVRLSPQAKQILDAAIEQYRRTGEARVVIEAHTDTSGPDSYNDGLGKRRLDAVRDYLAARGVPAPTAEIFAESYGEQCRLVETGDGVREPQNRRVELYFGPREPTLLPNCPKRPDGY